MSAPIVFPDAQLAARDLLRSLLVGRFEPYAQGVTVSTKLPPGRDEAPALPWVRVVSDGKYRDSRLNGRATIRFVVYHDDIGLCEQLAAFCEGLLLANHSGAIRNFSPLSGPLPSDDIDTGAPLSFFTLTARLRPTQLER